MVWDRKAPFFLLLVCLKDGSFKLRCMISKGNQVKFARFVLLAVSEKAKTHINIFFSSMYNKTIIRFGFL